MTNNKIKVEDLVPNYVMRDPCERLLGQKDLKKTIRFCFLDGTYVEYSLEKNDGTLQDFVNKVQQFHELEKENKRLQEQLNDANETFKVIKRNIHQEECARIRRMTELEYIIKGQSNGYLEKWGVK